MNLCIVQISENASSETFLRAHAERLPANITVLHGLMPKHGDRSILPQSPALRIARKACRVLTGKNWQEEIDRSYANFLYRNRSEAVLAEYGPLGVRVMEACRRAGVPLIVHFHGYDASMRSVLEEHAESYPRLFHKAAAIIAVSRAMQARLIGLGAPAEKVHYNPYGVDCQAFGGAEPASAAPVFLAVGRFVGKKAPHLTLLAFAEVHRACPEARLRMIGQGGLLDVCRDLARGLGIADAVTFLGPQPPEVVQEEMRRARAFVQHSVEAANGDCEGTPVSILEAGASGLPVVATRHAGIPDVVNDGVTGLLVEEWDVAGMADRMLRLAREPDLAGAMGRAAQERIQSEFEIEDRIGRLWSIIKAQVDRSNSQPSDARQERDQVGEALVPTGMWHF